MTAFKGSRPSGGGDFGTFTPPAIGPSVKHGKPGGGGDRGNFHPPHPEPPPHKPKKPPKHPTNPPIDFPLSNIYLSFASEDLGGGNIRKFQAMVGENPPTIIPGLPIWNEVARPLMRSVLIPAGYNLAQMQIDLRLGQWGPGWDTSQAAGEQTEDDLLSLDIMAGNAGYYEYNHGTFPVVYVAAHKNHGVFSNLIPQFYQYAPYQNKHLFPWVISALTYGTSYRNHWGDRVYQEVSMTLKQFLNTIGEAGAPNPPTTEPGGWFKAHKGRDTALLIAGDPTAHSPTQDQVGLAWRIVHANGPFKGAKNPRLHLKNIHQHIKTGKKVWVPSHKITPAF